MPREISELASTKCTVINPSSPVDRLLPLPPRARILRHDQQHGEETRGVCSLDDSKNRAGGAAALHEEHPSLFPLLWHASPVNQFGVSDL